MFVSKLITLKKSNRKKTSESKLNENEELLNLDKELKDLIKKNESLKIGIAKIFEEIKKDMARPFPMQRLLFLLM